MPRITHLGPGAVIVSKVEELHLSMAGVMRTRSATWMSYILIIVLLNGKPGTESATTLVAVDKHTQAVLAHVVPKKRDGVPVGG